MNVLLTAITVFSLLATAYFALWNASQILMGGVASRFLWRYLRRRTRRWPLRSRRAPRPVRGVYRSIAEPGLVVIDKENGRCKSGAVNAGINAASGALVLVIDADTVLEPDALSRAGLPFLEDRQSALWHRGPGCTPVYHHLRRHRAVARGCRAT